MIPTTIALTLGLALALFGVAVFWLEAIPAPGAPGRVADRETLRVARRTATAGRWAAGLGVTLRLAHGGTYGTAMVTILLLATLAVAATLITKANVPVNPTIQNPA
jgi:hypothetical protein